MIGLQKFSIHALTSEAGSKRATWYNEFSKAKFHGATGPMPINISAQRISGAQIKDGRKLLGWAQQKLAELADLARETVRRVERGEAGRGGSIEKAAQVLRSSGIEFVPGGGVRLMRPQPAIVVLGDELDAGR
jgi:DNA-binding XRE family transcriptional regulator